MSTIVCSSHVMMGRAYFYGERGITLIVKEIIVVEGKADRSKILQAVKADTIETNGSAINQATLKQIKHAKEKRGVIIFTDPDYPGERIRHIIDQAVPGCKHAFLTKEQAQAKQKGKSLGIENASVETIREALQKVYELQEHPPAFFEKSDLIRLGLMAGAEAKRRRHRLGELLHIGHTNGKQLLHRLTMFNITKPEFEQAMKQVLKEEKE